MVELCTIGYLMGTCVAYFVVVGDLGPQIIAKLFDMDYTSTLRSVNGSFQIKFADLLTFDYDIGVYSKIVCLFQFNIW